MKENELRELLEAVKQYVTKLGFYVDDIDIDIYTRTEHTVGSMIPVILDKQWRVSIELLAPLEDAEETEK